MTSISQPDPQAAATANTRVARESVAVPLRPLSIAPMMEWTDRDYRFFMRQITAKTFLYTEMVTTAAILHGDRERLLGFQEIEKPLALQLGGDNPRDLAECARIAADLGYNEINLNVGCPSDRVQSGNFGACLMARPELVAECVAAMRTALSNQVPVTVKHRIGIDRIPGATPESDRALDEYADLHTFVRTVSAAGCRRFIVHSRIAVLGGLSPRENRDVPPLRYADVYQLKRDFPELRIELNGGVRDLTAAAEHAKQCDGVMIGRAAYETPWIFAGADRWHNRALNTLDTAASAEPATLNRGTNHPNASRPTRRAVLTAMTPYLANHIQGGGKPHQVLRHMMGLFAGEPGARAYRRAISEKNYPTEDAAQTIAQLSKHLSDEILDASV